MRNFHVYAPVALLPLVLITTQVARGDSKPFAPSEPAQVVAEFPASPVGDAARAFLQALSSPDESSVTNFADRFLGPDLVGPGGKPWSRERYVRMLDKLKVQSGGLTLLRVRHDAGNPARLAAIFDASLTEPWVGVEFEASPQHADKLRHIDLHLMISPRIPGPAWPAETLERAELAAALQRRVQDAFDHDRLSGVILVARGNDVLLHAAGGLANRQRGIPNTLDTRFNTASVGKMFTGVAVAQLVEQGKLEFDDALAEVLPEYPNRSTARRVTIHHLLTHTSGIGDPFFSPHREPGRWYPTSWDNIRLFADQPLAFEPGSRHEYSNGNYAVLAAVVEEVTGKTFADYVRENVYRRAGMQAAEYAAHRSLPPAIGYTHYPDTDPLALEQRRPASGDDAAEREAAMPGFGGLSLTAHDLFRFFRALREHRLLGPEMTETVTSGKVAVVPGAPARYAYGFYDQQTNGTSVRGHSGGGGHMGYGAHAELVWDKDISVIVLGNYDLEYVRPVAMDLVGFLTRQ